MVCSTVVATTRRGTGCVGVSDGVSCRVHKRTLEALRVSAWRCGLRLVALAVLAVVAASLCTAPAAWAADSSGKDPEKNPVYLLNATYSLDPFMADDAKALWLGIDSALHASGYKTANGRPVEIVNPDPSIKKSDIIAVVQKALEKYPTLLGVIGPFMDPLMSTVMKSDALKGKDLIFMAPFTGSNAVRMWDNDVYFTRGDPWTEMTIILTHMLKRIRARRTAFMYLTGAQFGDSEYKMVVSVLSSFSLDPPAVYSAPYSTKNTAVNKKTFDAMADTRPQVIIVWGIPGEQVVKFLQAVLTDPRTSSAYIMTCFPLQRIVFRVYYDLAMAGKLTPVDGQIMSSATSLPISHIEIEHVRLFRTEMGEYMKKTGRVDASLWADEAKAVQKYGPRGREASSSDSAAYADKFYNEHPSTGQLMIAGWLSGKLIDQTLHEPLWTIDRKTYKAGLFDQTRYVIGGDIVLGDYGGPCTPIAEFLGAVCYCNQGGRASILQGLKKAAWELLPDAIFHYAQSACYLNKIVLSKPLNVVTLNVSDLPKLRKAAADMAKVIPLAISEERLDFSAFNPATLNATQTTAQGVLDWEFLNYSVDVVTGPLLRSIDLSGLLVISPVFNRPNVLVEKENYLFLMPTLEQEMYVMYSELSSVRALTSIGEDVNLVLHEYTSANVKDISAVALRTAATFNAPDPTVKAVSSGTSLKSSLEPSMINYVLGITDDDVDAIAAFLSTHPLAIVVISFGDLAHEYELLTDTFAKLPNAEQARLLTFTNLPLWSDMSPSSLESYPLLKLFNAIFPKPADHTPSLLRDLLSIVFIHVVAYGDGGFEKPTSLQESAYKKGVINAYSVTLGRFTWNCTNTTSGLECLYRNYGAQGIVMLSVQRMLDPTVPQVSSPSTPTMEYRPRQKADKMTSAQRNGLIAGLVMFTIILLTAAPLILYWCTEGRDNDAAPKDGDEPVTLLFTDIESSTALWAALPQLMADAIAAHHRVIRQLVKKYGCYEVKTIGDSFMIACRSAHSAVSLACEIQTKLLKHDWGTEALDRAYREFELARVDTLDDYEPPTARLSEEEYAALWCGLRVRVGIHTGLTDIRYDEVTRGYDYYGDTSNMAARTEAVANGGQAVATEAAWWALSNDERAGIAHTAMGPQGLRGVPFAVEMFQLNAVPGRRHAALRTEIEAILPDDTATDTASSAAGALLSSVGTINGPAAGIAFVLASCFAPYPVAQRVRELQPLLSKWGVGAPPRSRLVSEEDYCQGLMNRLAIRIATVSQARQRMGSNETGVSGDLQNIISSGVLNPLLGEGSFISDGARARHSGLTAVPPSAEPSAMRESRLWRRSTMNGLTLSRGPSSRKESLSVNTAGFHDDVVPFTAQASRRLSEEHNSRSASISCEVVVVRMPMKLGRRRRPSLLEPLAEDVADEA
ncbi:receptor-type_adenylate_cyclase_-_putative [Leishmania infantum]|uniref:adenylate cyclase n=2 Tax=Leishmania infantum TaxID=5671 RepID=A0A6L0X2I3_LEIIN|nr:receptor-type_adenylate_cyclase_-_putative [Leishmania infantum]SUZ40779.1 receptor-type_adenylate_cyclase_-_putative [Leishmania infantum]